jgi:BirA family biotin operon repressor/biotin-[acetyl-CoA-carboxylase] ligase
MDPKRWKKALADLPLGELYFFPSLPSTNQSALALLDQGAPEFSLVAADHQTQGRGRQGRRWLTTPGSGLAFSLLIRPEADAFLLSRLNGWAGLGVSRFLQEAYSLPVCLKWPNDVLVRGKKAGGVLIETRWQGEELQGGVVGIGINVAPDSVPEQNQVRFPATSLEKEAGEGIERPALLAGILTELLDWYPRLAEPELLTAWEKALAYRGEWVRFQTREGTQFPGLLLGLTPEGKLRLKREDGQEYDYRVGEIRLRLVDRSEK